MHLLKKDGGYYDEDICYFIYLFSLEAKGYLWSIPRIKKKWALGGMKSGFYSFLKQNDRFYVLLGLDNLCSMDSHCFFKSFTSIMIVFLWRSERTLADPYGRLLLLLCCDASGRIVKLYIFFHYLWRGKKNKKKITQTSCFT